MITDVGDSGPPENSKRELLELPKSAWYGAIAFAIGLMLSISIASLGDADRCDSGDENGRDAQEALVE